MFLEKRCVRLSDATALFSVLPKRKYRKPLADGRACFSPREEMPKRWMTRVWFGLLARRARLL